MHIKRDHAALRDSLCCPHRYEDDYAADKPGLHLWAHTVHKKWPANLCIYFVVPIEIKSECISHENNR